MQPSVEIAQELILLECYSVHFSDRDRIDRSKRNDLGAIKAKYSMTSSIARQSYNNLLMDGFLYPESMTADIIISARGIRLVEELLLSNTTFDAAAAKRKRDFLSELVKENNLDADDEEQFPLARRTTEFSSEVAEDGVELIEDAIDAIRASNEKGQFEKTEILRDLEEGKELVKSGKIGTRTAVALILAPLYATYLTFAEEGLKVVLLRAVDWLQKAIGF